MLIDLSHAVGDYLHDVFIIRLDWWVLLGFIAQGFFTMRFVVQWIASERVGKSVIPVAFWWCSIGGGILLLVYALYRRRSEERRVGKERRSRWAAVRRRR